MLLVFVSEWDADMEAHFCARRYVTSCSQQVSLCQVPHRWFPTMTPEKYLVLSSGSELFCHFSTETYPVWPQRDSFLLFRRMLVTADVPHRLCMTSHTPKRGHNVCSSRHCSWGLLCSTRQSGERVLTQEIVGPPTSLWTSYVTFEWIASFGTLYEVELKIVPGTKISQQKNTEHEQRRLERMLVCEVLSSRLKTNSQYNVFNHVEIPSFSEMGFHTVAMKIINHLFWYLSIQLQRFQKFLENLLTSFRLVCHE